MINKDENTQSLPKGQPSETETTKEKQGEMNVGNDILHQNDPLTETNNLINMLLGHQVSVIVYADDIAVWTRDMEPPSGIQGCPVE